MHRRLERKLCIKELSDEALLFDTVNALGSANGCPLQSRCQSLCKFSEDYRRLTQSGINNFIN